MKELTNNQIIEFHYILGKMDTEQLRNARRYVLHRLEKMEVISVRED